MLSNILDVYYFKCYFNYIFTCQKIYCPK